MQREASHERGSARPDPVLFQPMKQHEAHSMFSPNGGFQGPAVVTAWPVPATWPCPGVWGGGQMDLYPRVGEQQASLQRTPGLQSLKRHAWGVRETGQWKQWVLPLASENSHHVCLPGTWASRACGSPAWGSVSVGASQCRGAHRSRGGGKAEGVTSGGEGREFHPEPGLGGKERLGCHGNQEAMGEGPRTGRGTEMQP